MMENRVAKVLRGEQQRKKNIKSSLREIIGHGFHFSLSDSLLQCGKRIKNISTIEFPFFHSHCCCVCCWYCWLVTAVATTVFCHRKVVGIFAWWKKGSLKTIERNIIQTKRKWRRKDREREREERKKWAKAHDIKNERHYFGIVWYSLLLRGNRWFLTVSQWNSE